MRAIVPEDIEEPSAAADMLRLIVDTTPALIHTGPPDGHPDYFNRGWLDLLVVRWMRSAVGVGKELAHEEAAL